MKKTAAKVHTGTKAGRRSGDKSAADVKPAPVKGGDGAAKKPAKGGKSTGGSVTSMQSKVAATRKKTSGRRGIQLKSLGKPGGDGLN